MVPNLARFMEPSAIDQLWVADITYVRMREEFAYLAIILDAFSRRVIGWALETHMLASLVIEALNMAIAADGPCRGRWCTTPIEACNMPVAITQPFSTPTASCPA